MTNSQFKREKYFPNVLKREILPKPPIIIKINASTDTDVNGNGSIDADICGKNIEIEVGENAFKYKYNS